MKKLLSIFAVFVCAIFFLLLVPKAYALNPELAGIAINVVDPVGNHITDATVTITLNGNSPGTFCTVPNAKSNGSHEAVQTTGFYALDDVCCTVSGFTVKASAPNYDTAEVPVNNPWLTGTGRSTLLVNDGSYWNGTITLNPLPTPEPVFTCTTSSTQKCQQNTCESGWSPESVKTCGAAGQICCVKNVPPPPPSTGCTADNCSSASGRFCARNECDFSAPTVCCPKGTTACGTQGCTPPGSCTCPGTESPASTATPTPTSTPTRAPTPTPRPVCADPCANDTRCRGAANGCTSCLPKSITDRTNVCSPIPVCGKECVDTRDCRGARGGCTLCQTDPSGKKVCSPAPTSTPTPTRAPTPTPTPPLSCNSPCTTPASCTGAINGCTFCSPTTNKCEVPPACNSDCSANPDICKQATGGCNFCNPSTNKCEAPPACNTNCSGNPNVCLQASGGCNFCNPTTNRCTVPNTPTPTPTPFPFDDSMCACDGLDFTKPVLGNTMTINAFGKVQAINSNFAKIPSITFNFFQGTETQATKINSATINTTIFSQTAQATRYKAIWNLPLPTNLDKTKTYRIQAKPNCARKTTAAFPTTKNRVVLGYETAKQANLLDRLFAFLAGLFKSRDQSQLKIANFADPIPTIAKRDSLQLGTFTPAKKVETGKDANNCSFVKFSF